MNPEQALQVFTDCKRAYQLVFQQSPASLTVLNDIAKYCRADQTCIATAHDGAPIDVYRTFILEGRRDVYLMIKTYLELSPEQLVELYTRPAKGAISHERPKPESESES